LADLIEVALREPAAGRITALAAFTPDLTACGSLISEPEVSLSLPVRVVSAARKWPEEVIERLREIR